MRISQFAADQHRLRMRVASHEFEASTVMNHQFRGARATLRILGPNLIIALSARALPDKKPLICYAVS